jgi:hypothetical protein
MHYKMLTGTVTNARHGQELTRTEYQHLNCFAWACVALLDSGTPAPAYKTVPAPKMSKAPISVQVKHCSLHIEDHMNNDCSH